ncbi:MAG: hypothetical protein VKK62_05400 [Synechococcaceae cyanobacterium]|nr:hypothetical protein [Synechococcaceae cyanobacterium]
MGDTSLFPSFRSPASLGAPLSGPGLQLPRVQTPVLRTPAEPPFAFEPQGLYPRRLPDSALLLGNLDLSSLDEKPMLPAARVERAVQVASPDPLSVVPRAWKAALASVIKAGERIIPAEIVRLPAPHLSAPEQIPVVLRSGAPADSPAAPPSASSRRLVQSWLQRQPSVARGSVRPVVLELEPIAAPTAPPKAAPSRPGRAAAAERPSPAPAASRATSGNGPAPTSAPSTGTRTAAPSAAARPLTTGSSSGAASLGTVSLPAGSTRLQSESAADRSLPLTPAAATTSPAATNTSATPSAPAPAAAASEAPEPVPAPQAAAPAPAAPPAAVAPAL